MFFAPLPEPAEWPEHRWAPPEWVEPPHNVLPALVPVDRVLAQTDQVALTIRGVEVFPNGIRIQLRTILSRGELGSRLGNEYIEKASHELNPVDALRIGVSFPDGTRAERGDSWSLEERPSGTVLTMHGGGGGGGSEHFAL